MSDANAAKRAAAFAAADLVQTGTTIGLGSGSTFLFVLERLAERMREQGLQVRGTPTSNSTADAARALGIPLVELSQVERLDLAIDGADEVDPRNNLIKGGGAAHTRERIVAAIADELVIIVDDSKLVPVLGEKFLLPVEVLPFGWTHARARVEATGCRTTRRERHGEPLVTDNGNWILDCKYDGIHDPAGLAAQLDSLVGVVDHGLFVSMAGRIVVADQNGVVEIRGQDDRAAPELTIKSLADFERAIQAPRVLLFKHSPICPLSTAAHGEYAMFRLEHPDAPTMIVNVVGERKVARAIAERCGIEHESPQAILFAAGRPVWHSSNDGITATTLAAAWG